MILGDDGAGALPGIKLMSPAISRHGRVPLGGRVTPGSPWPAAAQSQAGAAFPSWVSLLTNWLPTSHSGRRPSAVPPSAAGRVASPPG